MKNIIIALFALSSLNTYAAVKNYQVTGSVLEVTATSITVQKGKEKWEIAKDATTKSASEIKKGDKVTVYYTMTATEVESKKK